MKKYIIKLESKAFFLTQQIGKGKMGEDKLNMSSAIPNGALIIEFEDPHKEKGEISQYRYKLDVEQFAKDCHEQYLKDKKK